MVQHRRAHRDGRRVVRERGIPRRDLRGHETREQPARLVNASDLGYGVRFSFVQEYFNLLCSDISDYPATRAVTASSAVPVLFEPVVVENYQDCKKEKPAWLAAAEKRAAGDPEMTLTVEGLNSYFKKDRRQYAHLVDGGITDNLGLRAMLHRYNVATLELMNKSVKRWARDLSTSGRRVTPYFIQVGFRDIAQPEQRRFFNQVPTSFSLSDEQVDKLIAAGRQLLRNNPDFQRFLAGLGGARVSGG